MYKLTALTKLILAIMISIASLITNDLYILSILALIEIFTCFYLPKTKLLWSALGILIFFSFILYYPNAKVKVCCALLPFSI